MIVEVLKLKLYGVQSEKKKILDALFRSSKVELKSVENIDDTTNNFDEQSYNDLQDKSEKIQQAIEFIEKNIESSNKKYKREDVVLSLKEFEKGEQNCNGLLDSINKIQNELTELNKDRKIFSSKIKALLPYESVVEDFDSFTSTKNVCIMLGLLPTTNISEFKKFLNNYPLTICEFIGEESNVLKIYSHKNESENVLKRLNELGFVKCKFDGPLSASEQIDSYNKKIEKINEREKYLIQRIISFEKYLKKLQVEYDYLGLCKDKLDADNYVRSTHMAFVLEGYLPAYAKDEVEKLLNSTSKGIEFDFNKPTKNENPPTILKNNKVVSSFEFITNMYSPPNYRELDPNVFLAFFFAMFFGFIMADIGYGLVFILLSVFINFKQKKNTGFKQLMTVIGYCGVFTIIFGILFGSFFGLTNSSWSLIPKAIMPDPVNNVITMLAVCLAFGVFQIMVSFFLKGVQLCRRKKVAEGIFAGFVWDFFFVGLAMFVLDYANITVGLSTPGLIIAISSVGISVVGQFIINKGFNKISKSFGSLYGIINIFSDILSYARLFGLMLSGTIIASIVDDLSAGFLNSASTFIVGVIILLIGHGFNISMGALGAYIHVSRLQYIEFFSRFYEGEGELFVPFGSKFSYINLVK